MGAKHDDMIFQHSEQHEQTDQGWEQVCIERC